MANPSSSKYVDECILDVRLVERNIRKGLITRDQYETYLKTLPDLADDGDVINLESYQKEVAGGRGDTGTAR